MFSGVSAAPGRRGDSTECQTVRLDTKTHLTNRFKQITEDYQEKKTLI